MGEEVERILSYTTYPLDQLQLENNILQCMGATALRKGMQALNESQSMGSPMKYSSSASLCAICAILSHPIPSYPEAHSVAGPSRAH